jgi:hypothetical protein
MDASGVSEDMDHPRRRFIGAAAMTVAAAQFGMGGSADAQTGTTKPNLPAIKPATNTSFAPPKQIDAGLLNVGYAAICRREERLRDHLLFRFRPVIAVTVLREALCFIREIERGGDQEIPRCPITND